jgi:hypothetical protein
MTKPDNNNAFIGLSFGGVTAAGGRRDVVSGGVRRSGANWAAWGRRRSRRADKIVATIGMRDRLGMNEPVLEPALNGHRFGLGDQVSALAAPSGLNKGAPAIVLNDELVAKDLGDLTLHRHFAPVVHGYDWGGREHH